MIPYPPQAIKWLNEAGISQEVARELFWLYSGHDKWAKWTFTTGAGYRRRVIYLTGKLKAELDPTGEIVKKRGHGKNEWETTHKDAPIFYPPRLAPDDDGVIYCLNGEKSVAASYTAGVRNCFCLFGEGNRMEEALTSLKQCGVRVIINIADTDAKGLAVAQEWVAHAPDYGIEIVNLDLRAYFERVYGMERHEYQTPKYDAWGNYRPSSGKDTRDLWLLVECDPDLYRLAIDQLPPLDFTRWQDELTDKRPPDPPRIPRTKITDPNSVNNFERVKERIDLITYVGQHVKLRRGGKNHVGHCPFHEDDEPSLLVNDRRVKCLGTCNAEWDLYQYIQHRENCTLYEALKIAAAYAGIEIIRARIDQSVDLSQEPAFKELQKGSAPATVHGFWQHLIIAMMHAVDKSESRQWQNNLLSYLRLADILLRHGFEPGQQVCASEILECVREFGFDRRNLYRILNRELTLCHLRNVIVLDWGKEYRCEDVTRDCCFIVPSPQTIAYQLQVKFSNEGLLAVDVLHSNQDYRAALVRLTMQDMMVEQHKTLPSQVSRKSTARRLRMASVAQKIAGFKRNDKGQKSVAIASSTISRACAALKEKKQLDWIPGEKRQDIDLEDVRDQSFRERQKKAAKEAGSTAHLEITTTDENGVRQPVLTSGLVWKWNADKAKFQPALDEQGKKIRKRKTNRYPLTTSDDVLWGMIKRSLYRDPETGEEKCPLNFTLVTKSANSYWFPDLLPQGELPFDWSYEAQEGVIPSESPAREYQAYRESEPGESRHIYQEHMFGEGVHR